MTAEIAIVNKHCIALAADSAVTIGKERVWKTANKLFSLGPAHDIGIMMHGSADFLGFEWEVLIKLFREQAQSKSYDTVEDCANDFEAFIISDRFRNDEMERVSLAICYVKLLESIKKDLKYETKMEFRREIISSLSELIRLFDEQDFDVFNDVLTLDEFKAEWKKDILSLAKDIFGEVITSRVENALINTLHQWTIRKLRSDYATGIVIAGFGKKDIFPRLYTYVYDGRCGDIKRVWCDESRDMNKPGKGSGGISPFGQADIIYILMEGISPNFLPFIKRLLKRVLDEKSDELIERYVTLPDEKTVEKAIQERSNDTITNKFMEEFRKFRRKALVNPVIKVVGSLPREEMAAMAEAMIDITSLRRRIDSPLESVGGPIDVAVITKGDGFIWIKRKHYFDLDKNQDFLYRKKARGG